MKRQMGSVILTTPKKNEGGYTAKIWVLGVYVVTNCNDKKEERV